MKKIFREPDPQTTLNGTHQIKQDGATIRLSGKGKHFDQLKKELEDIGMI